MRDCLDRIRSENARLHAFTVVFSEAAMDTAKKRDQARNAGQLCGPLHGVPIAIKGLADIAGQVTDFGSQVYSQKPAAETAAFVARLADAGAVIIGTTRMVEFAIGSWGTNYGQGTPWNPADPEIHRVPGGSSSGSAVAVAAGLVPAAIGTDTGGSVRIPAALCGVVGFKPSFGLIPVSGVAPLGPTFDTVGPIATCVADARLLFSVMADRKMIPARATTRPMRIGVLDPDQLGPIEPAVLTVFQAALARLKAAGHQLTACPLPRDMLAYQKDCGDIAAFEGYQHLARLVDDRRLPMDPFVRARVLSGKAISAARYRDLCDARVSAVVAARTIFEDFDFVALPTTPQCAIPVADVDEAVLPMSRFTRIGNYLDLCAISLPLPVPPGGMPVGLQLLAAHGRDFDLLDNAAKVEQLLGGRCKTGAN